MNKNNSDNINLDENDVKHLTDALKDTNLLSNLLQYYDNAQKLKENNNNNNSESNKNNNINKNNNNNNNNSSSIDKDLKIKNVKVTPAFCIKTHSNRFDKVYVMVSHYYSIEPASTSSEGGWVIPHSLFPVEKQKASVTGQLNNVYHIVFSSETYKESMKNRGLYKLLIQSAIKSIYQNYNESLNIAAYKMSKKVYYKEMIVSELPEPIVDMEEPKAVEVVNDDGTITPVFNLIKLDRNQQPIKNPVIIPTSIKIEILLSKLENISNLYIEIIDQSLILQEDNVNYNLNIPFSHAIDEENHSAKFNKKTKMLTIVVSVVEPVDSHQHEHHNHQHKEHQQHNHKHLENEDNISDMIDVESIPFPVTFISDCTPLFPSYSYKQSKDQLYFIIYHKPKDSNNNNSNINNVLLNINENVLEIVLSDINKSITFKLYSNIDLNSIEITNTIIIVLNKQIKQWWKSLEIVDN
ncbi:hypothetical protein PPL_09310 [Heterostelium album PN500]|uniref:PIH1 domain-containing protein 1 n=1 Tax=Heterostelium pallidum (strain ATCC 26659 / Pp 5 / PN500) TaxID=670386 RepID=D3BL78_HETP5|nr:hypothetical protein PPL_09310 [Heterostelium album PN500]EFA77812.1 hypothetical protein PPL_09310 [Heterostelium album PN500]|eukprot:XP_020429940.1 hypothetical protein PPL_09310 [Heterostelium album PN500]